MKTNVPPAVNSSSDGAIAVGTALVYPTLIAAVGDVARQRWRARAVGVYRLWRDAGYVVGALLGVVAADLFDLRAAVSVIAALSALSGGVVAVRCVNPPATRPSANGSGQWPRSAHAATNVMDSPSLGQVRRPSDDHRNGPERGGQRSRA